MKFNYKFSNLCGVSHKGGNVLFTPDGNSLLSAVGNRVTVFDLVNHKSRTFAFETRKDVRYMTLSRNGRLLVVVDVDGYSLIVNFLAGTVIHRFNFKERVRCMVFSPNDEYLAVSVGRHVQVWRAPPANKEFAPMVLYRTYTGHNENVTTISWAADSRYFVTGSRDTTGRVYSLDKEENFVVVTLTGHKDHIVGTFMLKGQSLPAIRTTDIRAVEPGDDIIGGTSDLMDAFEQVHADYVIYTVSTDGALIVWRWEWDSSEESDDSDDSSMESNEEANLDEEKSRPLSVNHGQWKRHVRYFLQKDNARIRSVAMHEKRSDLLVVGFDNGVFSLFEMPSATHIQSLSVSQHELKTAAVNCTGEWIALASAKLGQVLVWEWQSETYVLKQQGHYYDLNVAAYSPDGQLIATGGDDTKVKLWSTNTGFCFVTFSEHQAPVTALSFVGEGNAIVSASMDGTVRAFDLVRYRNFRTMVTPSPVQLKCLAVDGQGEVVCAGALEPPEIYVWSLQTGKLLDILTGHEGPISALAFSPSRPMLVSTSWDKTLRVWEPYESTAPKETYHLESDGLCVAFRPDGKEVCVGTLNGHLQVWDIDAGKQSGVIEGVRDVAGGRKSRDIITAKSNTQNKHFSSVCYTADGQCVIAGGRSKFVCIFQVQQRILLKKYQLSHNRSLDGILDKLHSKNLTDGGPLDLADVSDEDDDIETYRTRAAALPGAARADFSKRTIRPEIRCKCVQFSPTGQEWAAATTEGLMIFSLDVAMLFDPFELDQDITPDTIRELANAGQYGKSLTMSLHLGEDYLIREIYRAVPTESIKLVAQSIPVVYLFRMLETVASEIESTPQIERHLSWALAFLTSHNDRLRDESSRFIAAFRSLQRSITKHHKDLTQLCNDNMYMLSFLSSVSKRQGENLLANKKRRKDSIEDESAPRTAFFRIVNPAKSSEEDKANAILG